MAAVRPYGTKGATANPLSVSWNRTGRERRDSGVIAQIPTAAITTTIANGNNMKATPRPWNHHGGLLRSTQATLTGPAIASTPAATTSNRDRNGSCPTTRHHNMPPL